jgi:hypothetical protein
MKILFVILFVIMSSAQQSDISRRAVGIILDIKIVNSKYLVMTDTKQFFVQNCDHLSIGDTLYEYWINASKCCIGANNNYHLVSILKD